jgi:hypothetical protein
MEIINETIDDGVRYVTDEPNGITAGDDMQIYLPGTPTEGFNDDMRMWAHLMGEEASATALEDWFLYSPKNEAGFVGYAAGDDVTLANPWKDMTKDELAQVSGFSFGLPEGAKDVIYRWMESDGLAEMQFKMDGDEYCARAQSAELSEGELMNISGAYFQWDHEEATEVNGCRGTLGLAQTGTEDCGCDNHIVGSTLQQTLKHEEADEAVQTLRRRQGCKCDVRTAGTRILLECADGCITTNCYSVGRTYAREAHAKGNSQIS